jgi:outer membrane protein assembly factor BamB
MKSDSCRIVDGRVVFFNNRIHKKRGREMDTKRMYRIGWIVVLSIMMTSVLPAMAQLDDGPWPLFGHDLQRTGRSPYIGPDTPTLKWAFQPGDCVISSPAVGSDGTIYVGSDTGCLYAINPDGTMKWYYDTGSEEDIYSSPAIGADGTVYVGSNNCWFYAVSADGVLKWRYQTLGQVRSSPAVAPDGTIYVGSRDSKLYAFNPDGSINWFYPTGGEIWYSSPAVAPDGTIYVGAEDGKLYAIYPDGTLKWYYWGGDGWSSPAVGDDGTIYMGSSDGRIYALNPDGTTKWYYPTDDVIRSSPAIDRDGSIYVGSDDGFLYALYPDGTLKWKYPTGSFVISSPAVGGDGTVYVGSYDFYVYAINPDGTLKWKYFAGDDILSSPALGEDGTVYIGSHSRNLYAIGPGVGLPRSCKFDHFPGWVPRTGTINFAMVWFNETEDPVVVDGTLEVWKGTQLMSTIPYDQFEIAEYDSKVCNFVLGPVPKKAPEGIYTIVNSFTADEDTCSCERDFEVVVKGWVD